MTTTELMLDLAPTPPAIEQTLHIALGDVVSEVRNGLHRAATAFLATAGSTPKPNTLDVWMFSEALSAEMDHLLLHSVITRLLSDQDENAHLRRNALMRLLVDADVSPLQLTTIQSQSVAGSSASSDVLTSEQAAKLLNVSRPHINKLLDSNAIPGVERLSGGHRRITREAVLQYKEQMKQRQAKASLEVGRISTELGLYDDELEGIPKAPKAR